MKYILKKDKLAIFITCLTLLNAILLSKCFAQVGWSVQIIAQPQSSMLSGEMRTQESFYDTIYTNKRRFTPSFNEGIMFEYMGPKNLSVSVGVLYSHQGQNYNDVKWLFVSDEMSAGGGELDSNNIAFSAAVTLNYLKVPIRFTYIKNSENVFSFSFYGGLYLGFLLNYTAEIKDDNNVKYHGYNGANQYEGQFELTYIQSIQGMYYNENIHSSNYNENYSNKLSVEPFNSFDMGAEVGAGFQLRLSKKLSLPVFLHYDFSFFDLRNINSSSYSVYNNATVYIWKNVFNQIGDQSVRNSAIGIQFGIKLKI